MHKNGIHFYPQRALPVHLKVKLVYAIAMLVLFTSTAQLGFKCTEHGNTSRLQCIHSTADFSNLSTTSTTKSKACQSSSCSITWDFSDYAEAERTTGCIVSQALESVAITVGYLAPKQLQVRQASVRLRAPPLLFSAVSTMTTILIS